jgi:hypothetical protein
MKYFPNPSDLSKTELKALYNLNRDADFAGMRDVFLRCKGIINDMLIHESVNGEANTLFRHIGALAFIQELGEYMKEVETFLKSFTKATL